MSKQSPDITVFIPVYNGELYIEDTINSIINQTYDNFKILIVDDSSTDNSYEICQKYALSDSRITLLKKKNGGSAVRSLIFALDHIDTKYMLYMSQDDILSLDLLENMYLTASKTDADCIVPNMEWYFSNSTENKKMIFKTDSILSGKEAFRQSLYWDIHGFNLRKTKIMKSISINADNMYADEYATRIYFLKSNKISFCDGIFYYRQDNENAITKKFTPRQIDLIDSLIPLLDIVYEELPEKEFKKFVIHAYKQCIPFYKKIRNAQLSQEQKRELKQKVSFGCRSIINKSKEHNCLFIATYLNFNFFMIQIKNYIRDLKHLV